MDESEFAKRIGGLLRAAREQGDLQPLSHYQRRFKGFEALVAREYAIVEREARGPASSGAIARDWVPAQEREHFTHLGEIARGGMGAIIRVRDETLGRDLAMKVVLGEGGRVGSSTSGSVGPLARRFLEEAKITAQLDHPGVIPVHQFGTDGQGRLFFTMKLVEGGRTLADVFREVRAGGGEFSRSRVFQLFVRVLETLAFAHRKGILHRDLKPANVMVGHFGEVYVMDWGLAKVAGARDENDLAGAAPAEAASSSSEPHAASLTEVGQVLGTPSYMPVEQARGESLDARADVYAVGAMLYELLAGSPPFGADGQARPAPEVLHRLLAGAPEPLARLAPDVPPELVSITEKAMAREREARYAGAMEFARDLASYLEGRVVLAHETGTWAELRKWIGRNRALSGALSAAVLLLAAGLVAFALENREARRNARVANENAEAARSAEAVAERERANAQDQARRMTRLAYASLVGRASSAISQGDGASAASYLVQCPEELRGWEWDLLRRRLAGAEPTTVLDMPHDYHDCVALAPGGRMALAAGPPPESWVVWDLERNRAIARSEPDAHMPSWVAFSPDGERFVTTGRGDETVCLRETATGRLLARAAGQGRNDSFAEAAVFSPDGRFVAAGSPAGVRILDAATLAPVRTIDAVSGFGLAWSPDGTRLVATDGAAEDGSARAAALIDAGTGAVLARGPVVRRSRVAAFSPEGRLVLLPITLTSDITANQVGIYDAHTLERVAVLDAWRGEGRAFADAVAWDPTGAFIATMASNDSRGLLRVFDAARRTVVGETPMLQHAHAIEFSPDGRRIRAACCFGSFWDLALGDLTDRIDVPAEEGVEDRELFAAFTGGGSCIVLGGERGRVRSIDLSTGRVREVSAALGKVHQLAATDSGDVLAAATSTGVWESGDSGESRSAERRNPEPASFSAVAVSSDGRWIVGGTGDFQLGPGTGEELRVWDRRDGSCRSAAAFADDVACLDFRPGGPLLACISSGTPGQGYELGVYDVAAGAWTWRARARDAQGASAAPAIGRCVAFDPGGRVVYAGDLAGNVTAWDAADGKPLASRRLATSRIRAIRPAADGARLLVLGIDRYLHVLEPATLASLDTIDVGGQGLNRDSEGWALAVHTGDRTRVAVTRQMGNLLLLDPQWTTESVRSLAAVRGVESSLAERHARLGFSGLVLDELAATGVTEAAVDRCRAPLRALDSPDRLNADAWDAARFPSDDPAVAALALRRMERCAELAPDDAAMLNTLGVARYRAGRFRSAIETLGRSREANRRGDAFSPTDTLFLAMAHFRNGDRETSETLLLDAREQITRHLADWVGASPLADTLRDELMRHWAEAERLIHGKLPPEFTYDLSRPAVPIPRTAR